MKPIVRPETHADADAVDHVVETAFGSPAVAWMVRQIRKSPNYIPELALVAARDGEIVGFVMVSYADLVDGPTVHQIVHLSPLAVAPNAQRKGVGGSLVQAAILCAEKSGRPEVVLEGSPKYYGRFGFEDSRKFGIKFEHGGLVRPLSNYDSSIHGLVRYPPAFAEMDARMDRERQGNT